MKTALLRLFVVLAIALSPAFARADGFIVVPGHSDLRRPAPLPSPHPVYTPLEVSYHHVTVKIEDQVAATEVDQEFVNPTGARLEGFYMFPLPKGARIDKFSMFIDGKEMHAELLSADKARSIYEEIVRATRDPALLEYVGRDMFRARIFPIEPNSKKRVKIAYTQLLKREGDTVEYLYPLNTEKFSAKPLHNVSIKIDLLAKEPLLNIYSPTHTVEIKRKDDRRATVGFEQQDTRPDMDFQLFFSTRNKDLGATLLTYRPSASDDGYFLLLASPRYSYSQSQIAEKDVVFVADTSGSMAGEKLEQLKRALHYCVANLGENDRFEVIRFSTEPEPLFDALRKADKEAQAQALKFIGGFRAAGGTAIDAALETALKMRPADTARPFIVVFLTDGRPTIGETNEDAIVNRARLTDGVTRVFCFGIGTDLNARLLDRITEATKAASQYVLPAEDIEVKVSSFFDKIRQPVLTDLDFKVEGGVRVNRLYPGALPDLFVGEQLVIFGRYSGGGDAALRITGNVNGKKEEFVFEDKFADRADAHAFIARLWATRRVGFLLDQIRLIGESQELKDEIIQLAREHGIITPYTSYLILEDDQRRLAADPRARPAPTTPALRPALAQQPAAEEARKQWLGIARADAVAKESAWRGNFASDAVNQLKLAQNLQQQAQQQHQQQQQPQQPQQMALSGKSLDRYFTRLGAEGKRDAPVAINLSQQVRQLGARTFYYDGTNWVDADLTKHANARRVQIRFGSKEYFELLTRIPEAAPWLALGANVQFAHGGTIYEIIEAESPR